MDFPYHTDPTSIFYTIPTKGLVTINYPQAGCGASALALQFAVESSTERETLYVEGELGGEEIVRRILAPYWFPTEANQELHDRSKGKFYHRAMFTAPGNNNTSLYVQCGLSLEDALDSLPPCKVIVLDSPDQMTIKKPVVIWHKQGCDYDPNDNLSRTGCGCFLEESVESIPPYQSLVEATRRRGKLLEALFQKCELLVISQRQRHVPFGRNPPTDSTPRYLCGKKSAKFDLTAVIKDGERFARLQRRTAGSPEAPLLRLDSDKMRFEVAV